ncbi:MAG TPA: peptide-methionine (S)-S-oxide reductase MsrA [Candidatus Saccharimonadales bacterium]
MEQIIFAAGCFWGVEYYFDQVPGVISVTSGYTGGIIENPTYEEVCTHTTGHAEAVLIEFDPDIVPLTTLAKHFFRMHDPTQLNRQGPDIGDSYRSAVFYFQDEQREQIERIRDEAQTRLKQPIVTVIEQAGPFYPAEGYHQKFAERTGRGMCHIPYQPIA